LKDIWPGSKEIAEVIAESITPEMFHERYSNIFEGTEEWREIESEPSLTYNWDEDSTYVKNPPFFEGMKKKPQAPEDIRGARCLAMLGDSVTTDHISPAGAIARSSPAGRYLIMQGERPQDFNSYGSRRGNHEVMMRGTFANNRIRNELVPHLEGGFSLHIPSGESMFIYETAMHYMRDETPLIVIAGKEYGTGSSRDWAAKGTRLLGVRAVIAESFERIHRSNLIGMGVLPLQFKRNAPGISGAEVFDITGIDAITPGCELKMIVTGEAGHKLEVPLLCRIDTQDELEYYRHGGISIMC
jgi:Aconitase A